MSVCEDTLTSILPSYYTTRVAVRIISPRTFPFTSSREGSLVQSTHHSLPLRKVKRTYSKSREDMMSTFLQERQMSCASPPGVSTCLRNSSMFESNFFCSSKSLETDSQLAKSVLKVKKYLKTFTFPSWQQQSLRGQAVSGSALQALSGTAKIVGRRASLSLNSQQYG